MTTLQHLTLRLDEAQATIAAQGDQLQLLQLRLDSPTIQLLRTLIAVRAAAAAAVEKLGSVQLGPNEPLDTAGPEIAALRQALELGQQ